MLASGLVLGGISSVQAIGLEAAVGCWLQNPGGSIAYKSAIVNDSIDLDGDSGYDNELRLMARVNIDMPLIIPNVVAMATPMEFSGRGNKNLDFSFGDISFRGGVPFDSKIVLDHYDVGLYYGVPLLETATLNTLRVDFGINVRLLKVEAEVSQNTLGKEDSVAETFILPMGYLAVQVTPIEALAFTVEVRGLAYSGNHYYDLIARARYTITGPVFVAAGWRVEDVKISEKDIEAKLDFSGPFAEFGLNF